MEQLKAIKRCLVDSLQSQLGDIKHLDAKELGEVTDAIKDLEEAMYYCSIIKAMEKSEEEGKEKQAFNNIRLPNGRPSILRSLYGICPIYDAR